MPPDELGMDLITGEFMYTNPGTGTKIRTYTLETGHTRNADEYDRERAANLTPAQPESSVLEGGGSTLFGNGGESGPQPAQLEPGPAPQILEPPNTDSAPNAGQGNKADPYAFQGNMQTAYGPAGQYAAMPQNMGGQSGFVPAPGMASGMGNFGQNGGGLDLGDNFGQVDESTEIQQQSQPAKPGVPGATPSAGYGPYPAAPWQ